MAFLIIPIPCKRHSCCFCERYEELARQGYVDLKEPPDYERRLHLCCKDTYRLPLWLELSALRVRPSYGSMTDPRGMDPRGYLRLEDGLRRDFRDAEELPLVSSNAKHVISFCLYQEDLNWFPLYCLGLKLNIDAVKEWFKGWTIHLYVEDSFRKSRFFKWISNYASTSGVPLNVISCREGAHPMLERYRPLTEIKSGTSVHPMLEPLTGAKSGICIVRDVDSILSLTDAKIIACWMKDPDHDVLMYSEYKMKCSCGGGIAVKVDKLLPGRGNYMETVIGHVRGRNYDEKRLHSWIMRAANKDRVAIVRVRMKSEHGVYCLDFYRDFRTKVLWANSFRANEDFRDELLSIESPEDCALRCKQLVESTPSDLYVFSHKKENRDQLLEGLPWAR